MILLGIDTATAATAVALRLDDGSITEARDDPRAGQHPGHATRLLPMVHQLLDRAGVDWGELDRIAVGIGPGTFTGLRVGIATARGLAQSLSVDLVGVSSAHALAVPALKGRSDGAAASRSEGAGTVLSVIDARRGEVFAAVYGMRGRTEAPGTVLEARAVRPERLGEVLEAARRNGQKQERGVVAVGDGAVRFREHLESLDVSVPADSSPLHRVSAAAVCELGACAAASQTPPLPDYRRLPDAEIALETAGGGGGGRG